MAAAMLKLVRPKDDVSRERKALALQHLGDVRSLDRRIKAARDRIAAMVDASGTGLVNLYGVGPLVAGHVLAEVGDVGRFPTKDHFATYNGTAPIDVSSGEQVRHRLSRSGNRRVNHALHIMAVVQIRNPNSEGARLLRAQTHRRQDKQGSTALLEAPAVRRDISPTGSRQLCQTGAVRVTYDREANAVYIHLTDQELPGGHTTTKAGAPPGVKAWVALDWKADRLVGIEVLDANVFLPTDLLEQAEDVT